MRNSNETICKVVITRGLSAIDNMALDSYLAFETEHRYLRIYDWENPTISLGISCGIGRLRIDFIKKSGISLVRRETGGGFLNHFDDLCFSVIEDGYRKPVEQYSMVKDSVGKSLKTLGVDVREKCQPIETSVKSDYCFNTLNSHEIAINGKKIVGIAQRYKGNRYLTQGSISISNSHYNLNLLFNGLQVKNDKIGFLTDYISFDIEDIFNAFCRCFISKFSNYEIVDVCEIIGDKNYQQFKKENKSRFTVDYR